MTKMLKSAQNGWFLSWGAEVNRRKVGDIYWRWRTQMSVRKTFIFRTGFHRWTISHANEPFCLPDASKGRLGTKPHTAASSDSDTGQCWWRSGACRAACCRESQRSRSFRRETLLLSLHALLYECCKISTLFSSQSHVNFSPSGSEHTSADSFNPLFLICREVFKLNHHHSNRAKVGRACTRRLGEHCTSTDLITGKLALTSVCWLGFNQCWGKQNVESL